MRDGIQFHIEGLRADGDPVPEPTARVLTAADPLHNDQSKL